jgi:hypothetical protein
MRRSFVPEGGAGGGSKKQGIDVVHLHFLHSTGQLFS